MSKLFQIFEERTNRIINIENIRFACLKDGELLINWEADQSMVFRGDAAQKIWEKLQESSELLYSVLDNYRSETGSNELAPPTDPGWDYHEIWTALHSINSATTEAISLVSGAEVANSATDEALLRLLRPALERVEGIVNDIS